MELDRLIETEQRNDALMRRAAEDAAEIVRVAREAAAARDAALASEVQRAIRATEEALAVERTQRVAAIAAKAAADVAHYAAVSDARIDTVTQLLIDNLLTDRGAA